MLPWLRRIFIFCFLALAIRYRAYLLDTESQLLYGLVPLFLASFFLFEKPRGNLRLADLFLLLFLGFFGLSFFFTQHPFGFFEFTTFFVGALIYFTLRFFPAPKLPYIELLVGLGGAFSVYGLLHFLLSPIDRLSGFFNGYEAYTFYPNAAALLLLAVLPFNVFLAFEKRRLWYGLLFLNFAAFVLTFSRGAYLVALGCAVLAGLLGLAEILKGGHFKKLFLLGLTVMLSISFAVSLNWLKADGIVVANRLLLQDDAGFASVGERLDFWKGALSMTMDHPWTGVGPGGFGAFYPAYQENWLALSDHPHNVFLKLSSEAGLPAALTFVLFVGTVLLASFQRLWREPTLERAALFLAALGLLAHNLIDYNLNFSVLSALFFVVFALLQNEATSQASSPRLQLFIYGLAAIALGVSFVALWEGAGLVQARQMQEWMDANPGDEVVIDYVAYPPLLPFEMNHFDQQGNLALELGQETALKIYLENHPFENYSRWLYFKTQIDPSFADELLAANDRNELEYYALFYVNREQSEEDATQIEALLKEYTHLLSQNAHLTVLSRNPHFAEALCGLYPEALAETCATFRSVWGLEIYKFNSRYGTTLTQE